jgi:hypothetical protein
MTSTQALAVAAAMSIVGCSKEETKPLPAPSSSAASEPAPSVSAAPSASATSVASTPPPPPVDCPKGSAGDGTFAKPCDAKGTARMMDVAWTGKTDEKGPHFRVTNKSSSTILYGKLAVYFYDKAKKQIVVSAPPKPRPYQTCGGNVFGGVMKAGEKAVITFSCVPKDVVPDGTASVEAEVQMVGFADPSEKSAAYYWRNNDLAPDTRPSQGQH